MDRLGDLGGPAVQDGSIEFVRRPACIAATCLGTPGRFFRFRGQTGCRQRYVGRAEDVKVFGRRPARTFSHAPRPASENLQGTKPREGARIGRCRALSYGDLAVDGPQLRWEARSGEWWRWLWRSDTRRFCDAWGGVQGKIGVAVASRPQLWSELSRGPAEERADRRMALRGWRL